MAKRRGFRPTALEALEDRVVLSPGGGTVEAALTARPHALAAPPVTVGALGDSYTDEYRPYAPDRSQARNWVEILSASRLANFGPFSNAGRGEPRNQGFLFNWARSDSTSDDVIANQLRGLAGQVAKGQVQYSWVFMGGNDFLFFLRRAAQSFQFEGSALTAELRRVEARAEANFNTAVRTLLAA